MKREFDVKLTYEQIASVERTLAEEIEYEIFNASVYDYSPEDIMKQIEVYRIFKSIMDSVARNADEECECGENCKCDCCHEKPDEMTKDYEDIKDERALYEKIFDSFYPEGAVVICNYDPNKVLPGEWVESVDNEGYWKRIN